MFRTLISIKAIRLLTVFLLLAVSAPAADTTLSNWNGSITFSASSQAPFQLSILRTGNTGIEGWIKLPAQKDKILPVKDLTLTTDSLTFVLDDGRTVAKFAGSFAENGERISGEFDQAGHSFPFNLEIENKNEIDQINASK